MKKIDFDYNLQPDPYVELYDPDDKLVLRTNNDKLFLYLCCQIKDAKAEGYYVVVPDEMKKLREKNPDAELRKYPVKPNGRVIGAGGVIFKTYGELLRKLI